MIYFDHAATERIKPGALKVFVEANEKWYGNNSSNHLFGYEVDKKLKEAKEELLKLLNLPSSIYEVIVNSGATEGNNQVILGLAKTFKNGTDEYITSSYEHPSVTSPFLELKKQGKKVSFLPITNDGKIDLNVLKEDLSKNTVLVSVLKTNNEIGSVNSLSSIKNLLSSYQRAYLHSDITQALGKSDLNDLSSCDFLTFSGHKVGAMKGIGALIKKKKIRLEPIMYGGGQENNLRSGTTNVPAFLMMVEALKETLKDYKEKRNIVAEINDYLRKSLISELNAVIISPSDATPYILNFALSDVKASVLVEALSQKGIYVGSTSACASKIDKESHAVYELTHDHNLSQNCLRLSFGVDNTLEEAKTFIDTLTTIWRSFHAIQ